ncbi:histone H3.3-like [Vespula pensylvanica]|uniref:histone H3.3-like n=1 Tax=Vespula pensylvanica TaxID=30213 RepID=UPI001CB9F409|nr:histone H3.3-like [Vespula pensylvanica]
MDTIDFTNNGTSKILAKRPRVRRNIPRRRRLALRNIIYLQNTTHLLIPRAPFIRLVRQIFIELYSTIYRIQLVALEALQEALEMYMIQFFEDSLLLTNHAKRVTLQKDDMLLNRRLRGRTDIINK